MKIDLPFLHLHPGYITITLHVVPGAKRSELMGVHGAALRMRLAAPATEGKANAALTQWWAQWMKVSKSQVVLQSGTSSRQKILRIQVDPQWAQQQLMATLFSSPDALEEPHK